MALTAEMEVIETSDSGTREEQSMRVLRQRNETREVRSQRRGKGSSRNSEEDRKR
jgi:hypothetical protein